MLQIAFHDDSSLMSTDRQVPNVTQFQPVLVPQLDL